MRKKASRIFENVKLLAPILLLLFGVIVFFYCSWVHCMRCGWIYG